MAIFESTLHGFLSFSPSLDELCLVWYGLKDLFTLHTFCGQSKVVLTIKLDDVTSGRKDVAPHGRLRAKALGTRLG